MKYGIGTPIENYAIVEQLGMDYIELPGNKISAMSDEEFADVVKTLENGKATCCGFNAALPPEITLCGEGFDLEKATEYAEKLCKRGSVLGIKAIGVGSPNSRKYKEGDDLAKTWEQVEQFIAMFADVAKPYNITIMYESLNKTETQFGLKIREGADLVKKLNRSNLGIVFDIYHMAMEQEALEELAYALPYVKHVHIAERVGEERRYPSFEMVDFYKTVIDMVVASGYDGAICTEAFHGDILEGGQRTLELFDAIFGAKYAIGCVGDDFTGSSDAASFLMSKGMKTILCNGIPQGDLPECDAVVIALKSRSQETKAAVADTKEAFAWLKAQGAKHLYFKYCSTFDSTKEGNIGPVTDMALEEYNQKYTFLAPSLPVNGRCVKDGVLYVGGVPLHETHMKNHPLNPMWASNLGELMTPQGKYQTLEINSEMLAKSKEEILAFVDDFGKDKEHFYIVPDYETDEQGEKIVEVFGDLEVYTGGSGILAPLADSYTKTAQVMIDAKTQGKAILLSGSCSKATLDQVEDYKSKGYPTVQMDPIAMIEGKQTVEQIWEVILANPDKAVLVYSSDTAENVVKIQQLGTEKVAEMLEQSTAKLAKLAVENGYTRIIVAGGETSSAVAKYLGYEAFDIGESIAPGVPVMAPLGNENIRVALKSGNFGQIDFFERALEMTGA